MPDYKARHHRGNAGNANGSNPNSKVNSGLKVKKKGGPTGNETGITGFVTADHSVSSSEIHHNGKLKPVLHDAAFVRKFQVFPHIWDETCLVLYILGVVYIVFFDKVVGAFKVYAHH